MRTLIFCIALLFQSIIVICQDTEPTMLETRNDGTGKWLSYKKGDKKPFTGTTFFLYRNTNKIRDRYFYKKGIIEKTIEWDTSGNITNENHVSKDSTFDIINTWYNKHKKKSEAFLINGKMDSTFTVWYANGMLKETIHYIVSAHTTRRVQCFQVFAVDKI